MWAQAWDNVEEILRPSSDAPGIDVTSEMIKQVCNIISKFENYSIQLFFKLMMYLTSCERLDKIVTIHSTLIQVELKMYFVNLSNAELYSFEDIYNGRKFLQITRSQGNETEFLGKIHDGKTRGQRCRLSRIGERLVQSKGFLVMIFNYFINLFSFYLNLDSLVTCFQKNCSA